jgi:hypothetical protein
LPSVPLAGAGGNATLTSMGTPSKAFDVLRGVVEPQKRTPSPWTSQVTSPPKTLAMSACAAAGATSAPTHTASTMSFLPPVNRISLLWFSGTLRASQEL